MDSTKIANEQIIVSYFINTEKLSQVVKQKIATLKNESLAEGQNCPVCSISNPFQATLSKAFNIYTYVFGLGFSLVGRRLGLMGGFIQNK